MKTDVLGLWYVNSLPPLFVISFSDVSEVEGRDALAMTGIELDFEFFFFVLEDEREETEEQDEISEAQIPESETTLTQELKLEVELATEHLLVLLRSESKARED